MAKGLTLSYSGTEYEVAIRSGLSMLDVGYYRVLIREAVFYLARSQNRDPEDTQLDLFSDLSTRDTATWLALQSRARILTGIESLTGPGGDVLNVDDISSIDLWTTDTTTLDPLQLIKVGDVIAEKLEDYWIILSGSDEEGEEDSEGEV